MQVPDREILRCKGPPILNDDERQKLVESVKWVDEVLTGGCRAAVHAGRRGTRRTLLCRLPAPAVPSIHSCISCAFDPQLHQLCLASSVTAPRLPPCVATQTCRTT